MADKIPNEIDMPHRSKCEVIDTEVNTGKNRKRKLSISESVYEYNDHTDTFNCETSTNKSSLYKDNQSTSVCKRTSEQSLSDVILKLTQQIEHIENNFAKYQNGMKNTEGNDVSCDDELIYQPLNKIIKYDNDIISANFCSSDENSIGSTNINTTKHVNKKIKLGKNINFQKDVDDSERDSKILTNEEVKILLESSYRIDDKIIYDDEDNTLIKTNVKTNEDNDSVNIQDQRDTNTSNEHMLDKSMSDNDKIGFSTEDQSFNESAEFFNVGDFMHVPGMCEENVDNSIDQDDFFNLTKCENDEIILDFEKCTSVTNEDIHCTSLSKPVNDFENILEPVDDYCINSESITTNSNTSLLYELRRTVSDIQDDTSDKSISDSKLIETRRDSEKIPSDFDKTTMSQIVTENNAHKINDSVNIPDQRDTNTSIEHMLDKSMSDNDKIGFSTEDQSFNESAEFLNVGDFMHVPGMCEENVDNSIDQDDFFNLTKCENDEIILDFEKCTSVTNEDIHCTRPFDNVNSEIQTGSEPDSQYSEDSIHETDSGRMIVRERKLFKSTMHGDDQEPVFPTLRNQEKIIFEQLNTEDLLDVNILDVFHPKIDCENNFNQKDLLDINEYVNEEIMLEYECGTSKTNQKQRNEGKSQSLVTGDQFISNTFYFGTENCRDVSVHTIHSLDAYKMNNSLRNNTTVHSMENNDSLVSLNYEIENSIVELYCDSDNKTLLGMKNKSYSNEEESVGGIMKQIIGDIAVSLESSNSYCHGIKNDTSDKSISDSKLIETRRDSEKIPSDFDKTTMSQIVTENNAHKINDSVNIPDQRDTNTSIEHMLDKSMSDNDKIGFSTEDQSFNESAEFLNVGDFMHVPGMCEENVDNSIDQDDFFNLTKCENDEIILDFEKCTSVTNEDIHCTRPFDNVNSEIQTGSEPDSQYSEDSIHETDSGRMIVRERKLYKSTMHGDDQEPVFPTLRNQEKIIFEQSNTEDLLDVNILDVFHPKINQKVLLDINEYVNEEIMLEYECGTSKTNQIQRNEGPLKRLTIDEKEILTELVNNDCDKSGIVTDYTGITSESQTCEDYMNKNISKKFKNQDDFLEVTTHLSDENAVMINERRRSLSFNSSDARQILESSKDDSELFNDSLFFKPSGRDLVKYGIKCEASEKSISQSLNNLENNVSNEEGIPQYKSPCLKSNGVSKSINNLVSSSYVKDYEDNITNFYDCELSSIEYSGDEDNLLESFEKDTSMDNCIFDKNQKKLKNATNSTSNKQTCYNNLNTLKIGSPFENCNNSTNVVETPVSLIHSLGNGHQYNEIISTSISKNQMQMSPDAEDKLESVNPNNTITSCNAISSFNDSDNMNNIQSKNLFIDQGDFNADQNLEGSVSYNLNNKNKSISGFNTQQNIKKSRKSYGDNESESSMKITANCTIPKSNNEEMPKINIIQYCSSDIDQSEIDKKKYLDEIIKNEELFNKFNEKIDVNESVISPFIFKSLTKSTNLKSALAKKATAHINIHDMGNKALSTYLTQQTMTLEVLEVLHKSLDTCPSSGILMEDPEGLVVPLMPHQKYAIAWLIWRESQEPHGGILADDMGLGKTLSMISLILKLKEKQRDSLLPVVSIDNEKNDVITGGTLVVCPASLINQWETEVKTKLKPGLLKVGQYYGINRSFSAFELAKNDLVITSYHVVMWDHKIRQNTSPIYKINWDRIILDEGHNIRNHKTQTSVAVCNIKSLNRWAITGTPIHNKEADFFTLLKFVRCKPFDDWSVWKRWVSNNDDVGKHSLSLLIKTLMLRRTKSKLTQFTTFNLPIKAMITIEIELSKEERNAYEKLLQFSSNLFATYLYDKAAKEKVFDPSIKVQCKVQYFQEQNQDKDEVFKDHPELLKLFRQFKNIEEIQTYHILVLLLRLRQICCHPTLIKGPITEESIKKEDNMEIIPEDDTDVTNNDSYNENTDIDTFPNNIDLSDLMSCLTLEDEPVKKNPVIESNIFQKSWISTKIKKICDLVNQKVLIDGNQEKAIIVSQWPSFLYLIHRHLAHYNAKMEIFSGAISLQKRNKIIREFNNTDGGPQILLLSLKAGGVGLNLIAANHMFLVDIHWNPQLEAQACDRIYRVGQAKPVYVYKFICSNTIETRILNIQTHKLQIADNLFMGTSVLSSNITIDDLKQIFQFH